MGIKEFRVAKKMTQQDLAEAVGVNYSVISKYESGKITPPADRLKKIADILGVYVDELMSADTAIQLDPALRRRQNFKLIDEDKFRVDDSQAVRYVISEAKGICELCKMPAPFIGPDGRPYLEGHYVRWLSEGGRAIASNVVALCPNCHTKIHVLHAEEDLEELKEIAKQHDDILGFCYDGQ